MQRAIYQCIRRLDHASAATNTAVTAMVAEALNELEAAYTHPSDRIVALETVLHDFGQLHRTRRDTPFHSFLMTSIDHRQSSLAELGGRQGLRREKRNPVS